MQYYRPRQPYPTAEAQEYLPPPNVSPLQRGRAPLPYRGPDMFTPGDSYPRFPSGGPIYRTPSPVHPSQQPHPSMYPSSGPIYDNAHTDSQTGYGMSGRSPYAPQNRPNRGFPPTHYSPSPRLKRPYQASAQAGGFNEKPKNDAPPAPPPQLYCELCKISCFGQACFDAHMIGQKHKKRATQQEALKKLGIEPGSAPPGKLLSELRCALCDVICTGADTYQAHIIGKQHQRTLRLHKALGKPVPECELPPPKESTAPTTAEGEVPVKSEATEEASTGATAATPEKKVGTPIAESTLKAKESESSDDCVELVTSGHGISFRCQLCNCFFTDLHAKELHLKGKRHQTQLRKLNAPPPIPHPERPRPAQPWVRSPQLGPPPIPGLNGSAAIAWGPRLPKMNGHRPPAGVVGGLGVGYNDGFFIPPYSFVSPSYFGPGGHTSSLGDLRYMHTKLRQVMPTDAETEMIRLTVTACESALKQINDAKKFAEEEQEALNAAAAKEQKTDSEGSQEKQAEKASATTTPAKPSPKKTTTIPSTPPPFRGVFRVGALATGLLLAGDRKADLVLVCNRWPTTDEIVEIGGELETLVKESRKQYVVTVSPQPENGLLLVNFSESAAAKSSAAASTEENDNAAATQGHMSVVLRIFFTSFRVLQLAGKPMQPKEAIGNFAENEDGAGDQEEEEEANEDENEHLGEALPCSSSNYLPKKLCIDALTEVRRAVWLQAVLSNHPVACVLVNVVRVVRHLMLNGVPDQWGQLSEYTLTILLERLSCLDMGPTQPGSPAAASATIRVRPPLLLRRLLEAFASGILLPGFQLYHLMDPSCSSPPQYLFHLPPEARCAVPEVDLLADLSLADRELITRTAQLSLRLVSFRQIYKVLGVEKFVPQQRRDQAEKRKANNTAAAETDASVPKVSRVEGEDVEAPPAAAVPEGSEAEPCTDGGGQAS